jgi:hypothetical protein
MKKTLLLFLFLISNTTLLFGQTDKFEECTVRFTNNSTSNYFLSRKTIFEKDIYYKKTENSEIEILDKKLVNSIVFKEEKYILRDVLVDENKSDLNKLNFENTTIIKPKLVEKKMALLKIIDGEIALLTSKVKDDNLFFIMKNDSLEYLIHNEFYYDRVMKTDKTYQRQLGKSINCDDKLTELILKTKYDAASLKKTIEYYYECSNKTYESFKLKKNSLFLAPTLSFSINSYDFISTTLIDRNLKANGNVIGFGFETGLNMHKNDLFLKVRYEKIDIEKKELKRGGFNTTFNNLNMELNVFKINLGYRRYFNFRNFPSIYFDASPEITLMPGSKLGTIISYSNAPEPTEDMYVKHDFSSAFSFNFGFGITYKKIYFDVRYSLPTDFTSNDMYISSTQKNISMSMMYRFDFDR